MDRRLVIGLLAGFALLVAVSGLVVLGNVNFTEFETGVAVTLFGSALGVIYWAIKPWLEKRLEVEKPKHKKAREARGRGGGVAAVGNSLLAGVGGGLVLIYIGITVYDSLPSHLTSTALLTPIVAAGSGIFLIAYAISRLGAIPGFARGLPEEDLGGAIREQTDVQVKPRIRVYQGVPSELRRANPMPRFVVVENALGGGPAMDVKIEVRNLTRNASPAVTAFPLLNPGENKGAGVPLGTTFGDKVQASVKWKDTRGGEDETQVVFDYQGLSGTIY